MTLELLQTILNNYSVSTLVSFEKIDKGFSSDNYKVVTGQEVFFLKKHRPSGASRLDSIEQAEQFFGATNIPVVIPIKTVLEKYHVVVENDYYVLYPFVSGVQYKSGAISTDIATNLGTLLAKAHLISKNGIIGKYTEDTYFKLPPKAEKLAIIDKFLLNIESNSEYDQKAKEGLELKKKLVQNNIITLESLNLSDRHLCFGDYYPDNIFFDEKQGIKHIFDLDMAGPAPRLFEIIYSLTSSCFWYSFNEEKIATAQAFIKAYHLVYPFEKDELRDALEMYYVKSFHETWMERNHYIKNDIRTDDYYAATVDEIKYLTDYRNELFEKICEGIKF